MNSKECLKKYKFNLPIPPTVNHFHKPAIVRGKLRIVKSKDVKAYQREVILMIRAMGLHRENIAKPVTLSLTFHKATAHKYDVSNFLKAIEDGLVKAGFLEDDHWIEYGFIRKGAAAKAPFVELIVEA